MRRLLLALMMCLSPVAALAQSEDDRSFLTALLEDNLSGFGRTVRITGFAGALSSRATFDQMTIADYTGVWITLRGGALQWNRPALLSGRIEISEMTAAEIDLPRIPSGGETTGRTARSFSLPELPVSVSIGIIRADRVRIGAPVLGTAAEVSLDGSMQLAGGEGSADLTIARIDDRKGSLSLSGSYANATRQLQLDLLADEGADGIAATLLGIPGRPAMSLAVHGAGPIDDFAADIALSTDGVRRVAGSVVLSATKAEGATDPVRSFRADLSGDIAPLLLPDYRAFFGEALTLKAEGSRKPDGSLTLSAFDLTSRALNMSGSLSLLASGLPSRADLAVRLGIDDRTAILLPLPGTPTSVTGGDLRLGFDAARGDGWTLDGRLSGLTREGFRLATVRLDGSGRIARSGQGGLAANSIGGSLSFAAGGIVLDDTAYAAAVGPFLAGKTRFIWQTDKPLALRNLAVTGQGYALSGNTDIGGLDSDFGLTGDVALRIRDLTRLSELVGRPLAGGATLTIDGTASPLTRAFDVTAVAEGSDLSLSQPELDRLLSGSSRITASVRRDATGTTIRSLTVTATSLTGSAAGRLGTDTADITADLAFSDLSVLGPAYNGAMTASARIVEADGIRRITGTGTANGLRVGQAQIDRVLAGQSTLTFDASQRDGLITINAFRLANPQTSIDATGRPTPTGTRIDLNGRLADMGLLAPDFPGPLTVAGSAQQSPQGWVLDLSGTGPGATRATVTGSIAGDFATADLALKGSVQSAILNPLLEPRNISGPVSFDLRMNGRPGMAALSGRAALTGGRLVAPTFGLSLTGLTVTADLAGGRASVAADAAVTGGGRVTVTGPVALVAPYDAGLAIALNRIRLRIPSLYDARLSGTLSLNGALLGGARIGGSIDLEQAEIQVPSTGLGAAGFTGDILHRRDTAAVRETRRRAGLEGAEARADTSQSRPFALDITVNAPSRLFVRGRGLDAEMGGSLRLTGSSDAVLPIGQFDLIRGRLDLLGKRLTIDEGHVQLQGALTPDIRFAASSESDGITATVLIEGPANEPAIRFTSSPDLPEEEVVARLLFGRGLTTISPFQAAQLASAIATLSGRGGLGVVGRLRTSFGLDDLDVTSSQDGTFGLRAGKYISAKAYTELAVGSDGKTEVTINLDVTKDVTLRGTVASDGQTGLGVFLERDY
jgi:translocation and assembly module TamB